MEPDTTEPPDLTALLDLGADHPALLGLQAHLAHQAKASNENLTNPSMTDSLLRFQSGYKSALDDLVNEIQDAQTARATEKV